MLLEIPLQIPADLCGWIPEGTLRLVVPPARKTHPEIAMFWKTTAAAALTALAATNLSASPAGADTTFTYQGRLTSSGAPVNDTCDFRFTIWDAGSNGTQIGPVLESLAVPVVEGAVTADLDFGQGVFTGGARWIQIQVRCPAGNGEYTTLSPRQPIFPTPYAMKSLGNTMSWMDGTGSVNTFDSVGIGIDSPLAALHVRGEQSTLRLEDNDDPNSFTEVKDAQPTQLRINKTNSNGLVLFDLNPMPTDGVSNAVVRFFRETNTTGPKAVHFLRGNNSTQTSASIGVDGTNSWFQAHGGNVGIGTAAPTRKLHVEGNGTVGLFVTNNGANVDSIDVFASGSGIGLDVSGDTSSTGDQIRLQPRGSSRGLNIYANSSNSAITAWNDGAGDAIRVFGEITFDNFVTNLPMINMFDEGTGNAPKMVLAHSPAFPTWGLQYKDAEDDFAFLGSGVERVRIDLGGSDAGPTGGGFLVVGAENAANVAFDNNEILARNNGQIATLHLQADGGTVHVGQNSGGSATLVTPVIQITGGSDFSEMFDVGGAPAPAPRSVVEPQPGMVVVIDRANPGRLIPSTTSYDRKVAGIISGAGGVATGMTMAHDGTIADGEHPVALSGRVYCLVDATESGIEPGDMLTTSDRAGHAMKASDLAAAHGAIIGKAMTSLDEGEVGLVLVLVNLQ